MLIRLLKYLKGYVRIEIQGFSPERFLNLCTGRKILLWNISKEDDKYYCNISVKSFFCLRQLTKKTKTKVRIMEKHGFAFFWKSLKQRKFFLMGIFLAISILIGISFFIWDIKISGNYSHSTEELMTFLQENNVSAGKAKSSLNNEEIVRLLRTGFQDIIWVSVEIKGTRLYIELRENKELGQETVLPDGESSDLIASQKGQIIDIVTRTGIPQVKKGDIVEKDTLLVSGRIDILNDAGEVVAYQYCHSDADIYIKYDYVYQFSFPLFHKEQVLTGEEKQHYTLTAFGKSLKIGKKPKYNEYETIKHTYPFKLLENFYLPFSLTKETFQEYELKEDTYTKKEALLLGKEQLDNFCKNLQEKGVQIVENNVKIQCDSKNCFSAGTLTLVEKVTTRKATEILEVPKEAPEPDESIGNNH